MLYTNVDKWHFQTEWKKGFTERKKAGNYCNEPLMFTDESVEIQQRKRRKLAEKSDKGLTVTPEGPCL